MSASSGQVSRLLALVPYLLAHPGAPIAEVAQRFGVSERQLGKDLDLLWFCGLPGYLPDDLMEAHVEGGAIYLRNAETIARPLRLGTDEALALLVGLRALASLPGLHDRDALDRTIAKLERAAGDAAAASALVTVDLETQEAALATVRAALDGGRRLRMSYYVPARDETTERDVDPMRVVLTGGRSYLEGWCRRAGGVRLFRLDRMVAVEVLDLPARVPPEAEPLNLDEGLFRPSEQDLRVTLELAPAGRWVAEYYPYESLEELPDGGQRLTLRTPERRWIRRLALRLGDTGRVVDPPDLVAEIRSEAAAVLAAYSSVQ
jgi:proteasome accessory factor C